MLPERWTTCELQDAATIAFSGVDKKVASHEQPVRLCNYTDVYRHRRLTPHLAYSAGSATEREVKAFQLRSGDVLITKDSEDPADIAVPALVVETMEDVVCGYHLAVIRPNPKRLHGAFLAELFQFQSMRNYFNRVASGATRFGLSSKALAKTPLRLPPVAEQRHIADLLFEWDSAGSAISRLLKLKRRLKRGLMQQLLTGRRRFPEFAGQPWRDVRIGDVLHEVDRTVKLKPDESYRLVSVRRRSGGFFDREVRLGKEIGYPAMEQLHAGDFVIARRQVLHGAMATVAPQFDGAYVSNAYAILVPHDPATFHLPFFNFVSQLPWLYHLAYRCSYGVAIEKMFFRLDWFMRELIKVPPTLAEQQKITAVLSAADREIELLEQHLAALKEQKKSMMQKLLTGQVRLPEFRTEGVGV